MPAFVWYSVAYNIVPYVLIIIRLYYLQVATLFYLPPAGWTIDIHVQIQIHVVMTTVIYPPPPPGKIPYIYHC